MALTQNRYQTKPVNIPDTQKSSPYIFDATPSDTDYFADGNNEPLISRGISVDIETEDVTVVFPNESTYTFAAGTLKAGVVYPVSCIRVNDTGTGGTVVVTIWT